MSFKPLSCLFGTYYIPQLYIVTFMIQLGLWNTFHFRVLFNIAMEEMKTPVNLSHIVNYCPTLQETSVKNTTYARYHWLKNEEAIVVGGFYVGYFIGNLPGGWLADKLGARHVMGICILGSGLLKFAYPFGIESEIFAIVLSITIVIGIFQGPIIPCVAAFIQCWIPNRHRNLLGCIAHGGVNLASITGNILTGIIIEKTHSWLTPFYYWPIPVLIWYIFYLFMVFSRPNTHPFITENERLFLEKELPRSENKAKVPWNEMLTSMSTYALICAKFGHDYMYFTICILFRRYMKDVLKMDIRLNTLDSAIPFACIWVSSIVTAFIADWVLNRKLVSVSTVRRVCTTVGSVIPGLLLLIITYIGCDINTVKVLYNLTMLFKGMFYSGMILNVNDITMYHSGVLMAFANGCGALAGVLSVSIVVGFLRKSHEVEEWRVVMWMVLLVQCITTLVYLDFTSTERQDWDYTEEEINLRDRRHH